MVSRKEFANGGMLFKLPTSLGIKARNRPHSKAARYESEALLFVTGANSDESTPDRELKKRSLQQMT